MITAVSQTFDGVSVDALAARLGLAAIHAFERIGSTQDEAHRLAAEGAPAGTLVVADEQLAGRGRGGRKWTSRAGAGLWMSLLERPADAGAIEVLSLRLGLALADALEPLADAPLRLKWPNDVYGRTGKLAGILVEARWRDAMPEWVVVGIGINLVAPADQPNAAGLVAGASRVDVLARVVGVARRAAAAAGPLDVSELAAFERRDRSRGRRCVAPMEGVVQGITPGGALLVRAAAGVHECRGGSLILEDET